MNNLFNIEKIGTDKTKYEIRLRLRDNKFHLDNIGIKPIGKRKYTYVCGSTMTNEHSYRKLSMDERERFRMKRMLEECPIELINEALEEAWLSIKPEPLTKCGLCKVPIHNNDTFYEQSLAMGGESVPSIVCEDCMHEFHKCPDCGESKSHCSECV